MTRTSIPAWHDDESAWLEHTPDVWRVGSECGVRTALAAERLEELSVME